MKLNELSDNAGAHKGRVRVGRGRGSGKGKTSGRGLKGQKSRSGVALKGFEGGQMPLHMRLPKRGFNVPNPKKLNQVNLGRLQQALDVGKFDAQSVVNTETLKESGIIRRMLDGVRILGEGDLTTKLNFEVTGISHSAKIKIEKLGGSIVLVKPALRPPVEQKVKEKETEKKLKKLK